MDNVKFILFLIVLVLDVVACSRNSEQTTLVECQPMASAYEVEFPDNSVRKSEVKSCEGLLTATALDQSNDILTANDFNIRLKDLTGIEYLTSFKEYLGEGSKHNTEN